MGDDDDRQLSFELEDQLLDLLRRDRVEGARRFVEEQHLRVVRQRPGDAEALLLPARKPDGRVAEPILDLVPQRRAPERRLHDPVELARGTRRVDARAVGDVVVDRFGKAVPPLEDHPDPPAQRGGVERRPYRRRVRRAGSRPSWRVPGSRSCIRLIDRRKVDLPHPEGPISAVMDRGGMSTVMSNSACFSPYQNENCVAASDPRCARARIMRPAAGRRTAWPSSRSSEPPGDVGLSARVLGRREQRRSVGATSTSSPCSMNAVRSETRAACCMLCVTITTVMSRRSS